MLWAVCVSVRSESFFLIRFFSAGFGAWLSFSFVFSFIYCGKKRILVSKKEDERGTRDAWKAGTVRLFWVHNFLLVVEIGKVTLSKMVIPLLYASLAGLGSARNINFICDSILMRCGVRVCVCLWILLLGRGQILWNVLRVDSRRKANTHSWTESYKGQYGSQSPPNAVAVYCYAVMPTFSAKALPDCGVPPGPWAKANWKPACPSCPSAHTEK